MMNKSESIANLAKALLEFQKNVPNILKMAINPAFKGRPVKYASLPDVLDVINPHLTEAGLVVIQSPAGDGKSARLTTTIIHAESGEYMSSEFGMDAAETPIYENPNARDKWDKGAVIGYGPPTPQGIGSCITYMRRYALSAVLKLNADVDDDGNNASNLNQGGYQKKSVSKRAPTVKESGCEIIKAQMRGAKSMSELKGYVEVVRSMKQSDKLTTNEHLDLLGIYQEKRRSLVDSELTAE